MDHPEPEITRWTLHSFAELVKKLRAIQKTSGSGYKTPAANKQALAFGKQVDAAIQWSERHPRA